MRTRSLSILATTATLAALLGCPLEGLNTPDAASLGAEYDSTGSVANSPSHDDAVDAAGDVSWSEEQLPAGSSALRVLMTDAPVEADSVFVTFCGIFVAPAPADAGAEGRDPGVSPVPRAEAGAGGASDGRDSGAAGAPAEASRSGAGGDGAGGSAGTAGAAGAPSPDSDASDKAEAERAEAERAEAEQAGDDEAVPMDSEREAAEREAAEREAANGGATGGQGTDAVAPRPEDVPRDGWQPINQECQTLDLLTLRDGVTEAVGIATLAPGRYGQIRLMLVDASIVVDGVEHELEVPSGMESGLKINGGFELLDGTATTITLDFDAGASVQYAEGSGYRLTPVINLIDVISHDDGSSGPREPAGPSEPRRDVPPQAGAGGAGGAAGAGGDGAGGRAPMPPPPPGAEPPHAGDVPPPPPPEQPEPPKAGDEPSPEVPPPPADEPPPEEEPEAP